MRPPVNAGCFCTPAPEYNHIIMNAYRCCPVQGGRGLQHHQVLRGDALPQPAGGGVGGAASSCCACCAHMCTYPCSRSAIFFAMSSLCPPYAVLRGQGCRRAAEAGCPAVPAPCSSDVPHGGLPGNGTAAPLNSAMPPMMAFVPRPCLPPCAHELIIISQRPCAHAGHELRLPATAPAAGGLCLPSGRLAGAAG